MCSRRTATAISRRAGTALGAALIAEVVLTAVFLVVILGATAKKAAPAMGGLAIGLALTLIHLISIPVTNTSVNPARSTSQATLRRQRSDRPALALLGGAADRRSTWRGTAPLRTRRQRRRRRRSRSVGGLTDDDHSVGGSSGCAKPQPSSLGPLASSRRRRRTASLNVGISPAGIHQSTLIRPSGLRNHSRRRRR